MKRAVKSPYSCEYERCGRKLTDIGFICKETNKLFCDDICAMREIQETSPPVMMVQ